MILRVICVILSFIDSPNTSTHSSPVMAHKVFVSRSGPQRHKKNDESSVVDVKQSEEPIDTFVLARGTVREKRRFSHDEGVCDINKTANYQKRNLIRASSDSNIVHNHYLSSQHSQPLSSHSDSSNSLSVYQQVVPIDRLSPPRVAISPSEEDSVIAELPKINRQFTSETSRSFSTSSDHYDDLESESEITSPDPSCPTPRISIQLPVPVQIDNGIINSTNTAAEDNKCSNLVSEMMEQFPSLLRSITSPALSNISKRGDFSHSLPNNLHMVGLDKSGGDSDGNRSKRCYSVTGSTESMASSGNSWLNKAIEGHTLSEIHEDSAESRASTKSPSPVPADDTLRPRSDAFGKADKVNVTRLGTNKSDSFDRKLAASQEIEQGREISRVKGNENGRRGSFLSRLLPIRGKGKRHQSESEVSKDKALPPVSIRPSSPSFDSSTSSKSPQKKNRFSSVLRRKKENNEVALLPNRDFSLSGGRLSPSPGARYGDSLLQQRSVLLSIYNNLNYWIDRHKEVGDVWCIIIIDNSNHFIL